MIARNHSPSEERLSRLPADRRQDHAMHAQTAMVENGFVHTPESAPWLAEYLHELTVFPNGQA